MGTVTLPLWLVVLVGVLALVGLLDRLLVPSARWFIRSRANKVLDEVSSRLRIEIRPFQQTRREALIESLEAAGAHIYVPRRDRDYAITAGLRMMLLRHLIAERDGLYAADPGQATLLRYYANSIAHLLKQW